MKKVIVVAMAAMVAGIASADLSVDWNAGTSGAVYDVGGSGGAGPFVEGGVVQLIWSSTPMITVAGQYDLGALGDEFLLDNGVAGAFGQGFAGGGVFTDADVGGNAIADGYFYTRVFSPTTDFFLDIAGADPVLATYNPADTGTTYSDFVLAGVYNVDSAGTTVVPEPATFGLMGIAGLGMFLARKKARR